MGYVKAAPVSDTKVFWPIPCTLIFKDTFLNSNTEKNAAVVTLYAMYISISIIF